MSLTSDIHKLRVGTGFDVHSFVEGRPLIIGGVQIDYHLGLQGHSDGDVLLHAITDSLLGASGLPNIGELFPDTDNKYLGIDSKILLTRVYEKLKSLDISIINIDSTIICEMPKISPHSETMRKSISQTLLGEVSPDRIGIKGTTSEKLGFTGRGEGIAAMASCIILLPN